MCVCGGGRGRGKGGKGKGEGKDKNERRIEEAGEGRDFNACHSDTMYTC